MEIHRKVGKVAGLAVMAWLALCVPIEGALAGESPTDEAERRVDEAEAGADAVCAPHDTPGDVCVVLPVVYASQLWFADPYERDTACSAISEAMLMSWYDRIPATWAAMSEEARSLYIAEVDGEKVVTSSGLNGRWRLTTLLETEKGFVQADFDASDWPELYAKIKAAIRAGRPVILGSRSASSVGHYVLVVGFIGAEDHDGQIIVHDPNGVWQGSVDAWDRNASGAFAVYNFRAYTADPSDGIFDICESADCEGP